MENKFKLKIIIGIASMTLVWMGSGFFKANEKDKLSKISTEVQFKTIPSIASIRTKYLSVAATAYAFDKVKLISQVNGRVVNKFVTDGAKLKKGDKILQIENNALLTRVDHAKNAVEEASLRYEAAKKLKNQNLGSELDIERAETDLKSAQAELSASETELQHTTIIAPFNGIINEVLVKEGDTVSTFSNDRSTIGTFVNLSQIEAKAYLSQAERDGIANSRYGFIGKNMPAKITFISSSADENTGTFLVKALAENTENIADGGSIKLKIRVGDFNSHNLPISVLRVDKNGNLSVRLLNENNEIDEVKVTIIDEDDKGVWITGLPEKANIVIAG